jgi:N-acetylglucosaminyl-diphospho-decaprenol L-rhamnosyltransferase
MPNKDTTLGLDQVTVIIVTYDSAHCIAALSEALASLPHVTVVDNASQDGTPAEVARLMPHANVIVNPVNLGFGAANNLGLDAVRTPYALLLNPDCLITPDSIARLIQTANEFPNAAVVAPQLLDGHGKPQINYGWPRFAWTSRGAGADAPVSVGNACAAAWLLRCTGQPWRFDTDFFLYYEDEDLCLRMLKARQEVVIEPRSTAVHVNRGSVRGASPWRTEWGRGFHHSRSKILFQRKHKGLQLAQQTRRLALMLGVVEVFLRLLLLRPYLIARSAGRLAGMWHAFSPSQAPAKKRPTLTIAVLALNEEAQIEACLRSAAFADQLLVVDAGSTDKTVALAQSLGAEVHVHPDWQGFAVQRNRLLQHTTGDWVFFLDADEVIPPDLAADILAAIAPDHDAVFHVTWLHVAFGQPLTLMRRGKGIPRLFPVRQVVQFEGVVHEGAKLKDPSIPHNTLNTRLLHHSRRTIHQSLLKVAQYAQLGAIKRIDRGQKGGMWRGFASGFTSFFRYYIVQRGILCGRAGFLLSLVVALESFFRYAAMTVDRDNLNTPASR